MKLDKQTFREYLEHSELPHVGLGNFQLEFYGPAAVWIASQGYVEVLVARDEIIYKARENSPVFEVLTDFPDWFKMWIAYEDTYLFTTDRITAKQALELLDKLPI